MSSSSNPAPDPSFEESLLLLQQIVSDLEGGSITLDQSLRRFEDGVGLLRQCYQFLEQAEQRIEQLVTLDAQGNCTLVPFDATATVDKQAKATKSPPRKSTRSKEPASAPTSPPTSAPDEGDSDDIDSASKLLF